MAWTTPGTATAGTVLTAAYWNTNVRDNTNALYGTTRCFGYQTRTTTYTTASTTVSGAANVFSSSITWTADGSSAYRVEFFAPNVQVASNANSMVYISLVDGSGNDLGTIGARGRGDGTYVAEGTVHAVYYYTPSAGSTTVNIRAIHGVAAGSVLGGAGGSGNYMPMYFAVFGPTLS